MDGRCDQVEEQREEVARREREGGEMGTREEIKARESQGPTCRQRQHHAQKQRGRADYRK